MVVSLIAVLQRHQEAHPTKVYSIQTKILCNYEHKGLGDLRPNVLVKIEFWNFEEKSIANSRYRSLLIYSSTNITFKLQLLPWQRSEKH